MGKNLKVLPIKSEEAVPWILKKHYAKRLPSISYAFGLYDDNELKGIVTFGMPASNSLCEGVCGVENKHLIIELNRLCLQDNTKNQASFLVSNAIRLLPKPMVIVSYADTAQGHIGYVYQATNFLFTGTTKERTDMDAGEGKHSRHGTDPSVRKFRSAKHRYIYIHGSKTQKAKLLKDLNYEIQQYPKGEIKRYDSGAKVITQQLLFG
jgi:predicted ATP-dependent Lon-type protease